MLGSFRRYLLFLPEIRKSKKTNRLEPAFVNNICGRRLQAGCVLGTKSDILNGFARQTTPNAEFWMASSAGRASSSESSKMWSIHPPRFYHLANEGHLDEEKENWWRYPAGGEPPRQPESATVPRASTTCPPPHGEEERTELRYCSRYSFLHDHLFIIVLFLYRQAERSGAALCPGRSNVRALHFFKHIYIYIYIYNIIIFI